MITIKVKAKTQNAYNGLENHFSECNTLKNRLTLRSMGVTQRINYLDNSLEISYSNLLTKLSNKLRQSDFKAILKEDQKKDFIKSVNDFMTKQNVDKEEYEVIFHND